QGWARRVSAPGNKNGAPRGAFFVTQNAAAAWFPDEAWRARSAMDRQRRSHAAATNQVDAGQQLAAIELF
ncbi:hypothetical protein, partial [Planosporangium mesophilum]|uniref:hypothetical protein n=1 Tax=Planosporangium mesophilum TaxID=689768 RepID=UPI00194E5BC4